jgi:flagellar basal body-associated protein FliL
MEGNIQKKTMNKNKLIFLIVGIVFLAIVLIVSWDIARQTTFPGAKGNLKERMAPSTENDNNE